MAHYDYWENKVKHSVLMDSGADLISYGMGEHSIIEIADALDSGIPVEEITYVAGTVYKCKDLSRTYEPILLPSFDQVKEDKAAYARSFAIQYQKYRPVYSQGHGRIIMGTKGISSRIPRRFLFPRKKWMMCMTFPILGSIIQCMKRKAEFRLLKKLNSALPATEAALEAAVLCPYLPSGQDFADQKS